ncbi:MAG: response regulator [Candidatus Buchananbacteria bacterium]
MAKETQKIILLVEDDEVLLRALYLVFHGANYTIATAGDGETALRMAERIKPDIILLDLLLPKMDGFSFLKDIKANAALSSIPVIVLSNLGDDDSMAKAKNLGATDYFVKSETDLSALHEKVGKLLKS